MNADLPSNIVCREIEFSRAYRDVDGNARNQIVKGIDFGLDFQPFAVFKDPSRFKAEYIIIHRPTGKSLGQSFSLGPVVAFLEAIIPLRLQWDSKDGYKRHTPFFEMIQSAAKRLGIENV